VSLRWKIVTLAIVPLLCAALFVAVEIQRQSARLAEQQVGLIEASMKEQKRTELRHAIALVAGELAVLDDERDEARASDRAKALIAAAHYGDDGYFFAYTRDGTCLVHPKLPELVGKNLYPLVDSRGRRVIPSLVETAERGSGFQEYEWVKPSTGRPAEKLAYVALLPRFDWVLGTGVYLDDVAAAASAARAEARRSVHATMWFLAAVALLAIAVVFAGTMALNVNERRLADRRLRVANERLATLRASEQEHTRRELHESVLQILTAIKFQLELAEQELLASGAPASPHLRGGLERVGLCFEEVRRIVDRRTPVGLDKGLSAGLEELVREFSERAKVPAELRDSLGAVAPPEPYASELYRVAQECLRNIEQSAEAKSAIVTIGRDAPNGLFLSVVDDGRGFDPNRLDPQRTGVGLRHIRERIADLGGTVRIASRPGRTEIAVRVQEDRQ
jgi:two-component system NarL family sensor kinase